MLLLTLILGRQWHSDVTIYCGKVMDPRAPRVRYDSDMFLSCEMESSARKGPKLKLVDKFFDSVLHDVGIRFHMKQWLVEDNLCLRSLTKADYESWKAAIESNCHIEFVLDDLSTWGPIGVVSDGKVMYYSHWQFMVSVSGDQIVGLEVRCQNPVLLEPDELLKCGFSVRWNTKSGAAKNTARKLHSTRKDLLALVRLFLWIFLVVSVGGILLVLRITKSPAMDPETLDEVGEGAQRTSWRALHGNVFRKPDNVEWFAVVNASAFHITLTMAAVIFVNSFFGLYEHVEIHASFLLMFLSLSVFPGYVGASIISPYGQPSRLLTVEILLGTTAPLFASLVLALLLDPSVRSVRWLAGFIAVAISFSLVLCEIGGCIGVCCPFFPDNPCSTGAVPRKEPKRKVQTLMLAAVGATCSLVFVEEVQPILFALKGAEMSQAFILVAIAMAATVLLSGFAAIVSTFIMFEKGFYKWHWRSFLGPFSAAAFAFLYSVQFVLYQTRLSGFRETLVYCLYGLVLSVTYGMVCGSAGYISCALFVRAIFQLTDSK